MTIPFNAPELDRRLGEAGIDALVATSKHNVQYLLGGYRYFFFANMDAIGLSRYLPAVGYVAGAPTDSFYVGCGNEAWGTDVHPLWIEDIQNVSWSSTDTAEAVAASLRKRNLDAGVIAVEMAFIPADALDRLRRELPQVRFVDSHLILEHLRGVKTPSELELVRQASVGIIDSMLATFADVRPGMTRHEIVERFRRHQTDRGMVFDYCLIATGPSLNRAPSAETWQVGTPLSLDSGGMFKGYIGDLARMAFGGEPTTRALDLLAQVESVQQAARANVKAGSLGKTIYEDAAAALNECRDRANMHFVGHGMGLITHEVPRLTAAGPVPYPADHAEERLASGNVLSIETWVEDPEVGFIKLEDTLIVQDAGWDAPGDIGREYTVVPG